MSGFKTLTRFVLGIFCLAAGRNHFRNPAFYVSIMPPYLPWHRELVYLSGVAEIVLGGLVMFRSLKRWAAWGLIALPLWLRLPLQGLLIAWAYRYTRAPAAPSLPAAA